MTTTTDFATMKQQHFLGRLLAERDIPSLGSGAERDLADRALSDGIVRLTKREASALIDALLVTAKAARKPAAAEGGEDVELEAGIYRQGDTVFKVQRSQGSGRMYAKQLTVTEGKGTFTYTPGAVGRLTAADRMDLEAARQFGAVYGVCCQCGRTLTDEGSIEAGIGPVCAKRF